MVIVSGRRSVGEPTLDVSEMLLQAAQAWRSRRTQREARPDALPPRHPPRPVAADGRGGSGEGTSRARGRGEEGTARGGDGEMMALVRTVDVAVAGGLATLTHGGERDAGAAVATEEKRNGGEVGTKRGMEERAARSPPPPKRSAVSSVRQFPPGCGRDAALPLGRRHGRGRDGDGGVPPLAGNRTDLPLEAVVDGGDPIANVHQIFSKSSHATDENQVACKVGSLEDVVQEGAANSGELLGWKQVLAQAANVLPKRRMVSATRRFPPGCGRDVKTGSGLEFMAVDASCGGVSKEVVATDGGDSLVSQELEEGEVADEAYSDVDSQNVAVDDSMAAATEDVKVMNKCKGTLPRAAAEPCAEGPSKEHFKGMRECENDRMGKSSMNVATEVFGDGMMRSKILLTARKAVKSPLNTLHRWPFSKGKEECAVTNSAPFGPKKKFKVKATEDVKVMNKCKGTLPRAAAEPCAEGPSKEHFKGMRECENDRMGKSSMNVATEVFGDGMMRSKILLTARKAVKSPLNTLHRWPFSKGKEECAVTNSAPFGPKKKFKVKGAYQTKDIPIKIVSTPGLGGKDNLVDKEALILEDDDILKALAVHDGKLKLYLNASSSVQRHGQHGSGNADDRRKTMMLCRRFQFIHRALVHAAKQGSLKVLRADLEADKIVRKLPGFIKPGPIVGNVRGVEVGDEFLYRVELALVGLHRPYQGGIDTTDHNGVLVAISIVASGGYPDRLSSSGELIYTGSGGQPAGKKKGEDQKLERGNLALKNCIKTKTPVRVIHGFKGQNGKDDSYSRAKQISAFTYDGLVMFSGGENGREVSLELLEGVGVEALEHMRKYTEGTSATYNKKVVPDRITCHLSPTEDVKVMNKWKGTLPRAAAEPCAEGPSKEHFKGTRECENDRMGKSSMNVATEVFGDCMMRSKIPLIGRKAVKSPLNTLHRRPFSKGKEECIVTNSAPCGPKKKLKVKGAYQTKDIPIKIVSTPGLGGKDSLVDKEALILEDDDILKALAVHDGTLKLYLNASSSVQHHGQHGSGNADDRRKTMMLCRRFQFIRQALVHAVKQGSLKVLRADLEADKIVRKLPSFIKPGPIVGNVRVVEVGDEFLYRVELALVGLHRPYQGGIDTADHNGVLVAISIVASGGYPDRLSSSGELIYTGSGGQPTGKKKSEDQKLERGNLALKNCIKTKTPVRVIHGFKGQNGKDDSYSRAKQISAFTYDGLYHVVDYWREGLKGSMVFKYRLQRIHAYR
uniref:YDG domain-containing protein n=1 Tax=Oryza barthii TaxID=65489 RepID=A0A0D3GZZ9_9ORYZ